MRVYLYIRVSTDEQADTGYSQRSQNELLHRYCEINGHQVMAVFTEDHSAKNFNRPQFNKLLVALHKHKNIDAILFTKWDRFSRNAGDAYAMINTLHKLGVDPQAIEQPLNLEIPENKMMLAFYLAAPEVENDRRALNVFNGMRRAKKEGRQMGKAPLGYLNKDKKIVPDPLLAPMIRWAFNAIADGKYNTESILKKCRAMGLKCSKNNFWAHIIKNPVYCGIVKVPAYKTEPELLVQGQHEPLISTALFYDCQDVLMGRRKTQRTKITVDDRYPLRGFLLCPDCGRLLTASSSKGRHKYYDYYHCISACGVRYKADVANDLLIKELQRLKPHPAINALAAVVMEDILAQEQKQKDLQLKQIKENLKALAARRDRGRDLLMDGKMDADDYRIIKTDCEKQIIQLESQWQQLTTAAPQHITPMMDKAVGILDCIDEIYINASTENKRIIIDSIWPEKLQFTGFGYRTTRINEAIALMFNLGTVFSEIKTAQTGNFPELCRDVLTKVRLSNQFTHDLKALTQLHHILFKAA